VADDAELKLTFRLVPTDDQPADPAVLDDIIRLLRQAHATLPPDAPRVTRPADGFVAPDESHPGARALESKIKHRVEQDSAASQSLVDQRARIAQQPDGNRRLADEALAAAQRVVAAAQAAMFRGTIARLPDVDV